MVPFQDPGCGRFASRKLQKKYKRREDTEWQRKKWKKQVKIHSEKNTPKYIKSISYGDTIGMSIHFQMNIYYIPVTTRQNALCFRCAFWLFLVQSRKWLKLYSCKFQWSQNPTIQSHFSINSYHKKEVCFGRIRIKRLAGEVRTFPCVPVSTGILSNNPGPGMCQTTERPRDWDLHCQETVWHTAWHFATRNSHPKIRDRFRLYI